MTPPHDTRSTPRAVATGRDVLVAALAGLAAGWIIVRTGVAGTPQGGAVASAASVLIADLVRGGAGRRAVASVWRRGRPPAPALAGLALLAALVVAAPVGGPDVRPAPAPAPMALSDPAAPAAERVVATPPAAAEPPAAPAADPDPAARPGPPDGAPSPAPRSRPPAPAEEPPAAPDVVTPGPQAPPDPVPAVEPGSAESLALI